MLTNEKAFTLFQFLNSSFSGDIELSLTGNLVLQKNIRALKSFVEDLGEVEKRYKKDPKIDEYNSKKEELLDPYIEKDEKGSPVLLPGGSAKLIDDSKEAEEKLKEVLVGLNEEFEDDLAKYNAKLLDWGKFYLSEPAKVELEKISKEDIFIPANKHFKKGIFEALSFIIDFEDISK